MERGEKTTLVLGFLERRWVVSVVETWVWLLIDCCRSIVGCIRREEDVWGGVCVDLGVGGIVFKVGVWVTLLRKE
ncbi:hypothetical protein Hanom_Chr05g00446171 [Helianthus anomalus]